MKELKGFHYDVIWINPDFKMRGCLVQELSTLSSFILVWRNVYLGTIHRVIPDVISLTEIYL